MTRYRTRKRQRTYDHEITLIGEKLTYDDLKNPVVTEVSTTVLCDVESIGQGEFYDASAQGLKPTLTFVIHSFEYNDEQVVTYKNNDDRYKVMRTYANDYEEVELTCERVVGNV